MGIRKLFLGGCVEFSEMRGFIAQLVEIGRHGFNAWVDGCTKFAFRWGTKMPSIVEFNLAERHGGTVVHLKEFDYPNSDQGLENILECAAGWGEALTLLKFYLELGVVYSQPQKES